MANDINRKERIEQILAEVDKLSAEHFQLLQQLRRSIRIKELWPEAFDGKCTCRPFCIGTAHSPGSRQEGERYPYPYEWVREVKRCGLRRSDGEEKLLTMTELCSIYDGTRP